MNDRASALTPVAALEDPTRRRIYDVIRKARRPISREEVAEGLGISRKLAAFHLDKMADRGLLKSHYARPPGRGGPGAGRSAKYYEPSGIEIQVSIPARHYDLAGELLLEAVRSHGSGESASEAAFRISAERGVATGEEIRRTRRLRPLGPERALTVAQEILDEQGFEPYRDAPGVLALKNCPFHSFAQAAPDLMCSMNQAYIDGILRGLGSESVEAELSCKAGDCCVTLHRRNAARRS
jgi:predicted ArsR family transcriptional regulator